MSDGRGHSVPMVGAPAAAQAEVLIEVARRLGDTYVIEIAASRRLVVSVLLTDEDVVDDLADRFGAAPALDDCSSVLYVRAAALPVSDHSDGVTRSWQVRLVTSRPITPQRACACASCHPVGAR